jgi:hypothetical protein
VPDARDQSHYSSVASWLDRETLAPVRVEKTLRGSAVVKEFVYFGLRESKGVWSASQIEVRTRGVAGSSFLIISRGAEKARVSPADLDPALLIRP